VGDVVKLPARYKTYWGRTPTEENIRLIEERDAAKLTGLTSTELVDLLTPITPVLYFRLDDVVALRDRLRKARDGARIDS
jgi:hypothetical protein